MRPEPTFIAHRMAAQHSPELLGPTTPSLSELTPALAQLAERLAGTLAAGLQRLSGGDAPRIRPAAPCLLAAQAQDDAVRTLATHAVLGIGPERHRVRLTCAAAPVFRLVDRAFGGRGTVPDPLPEAFPLSAELLVARLEQTLAGALQSALGGGALTVLPLERSTRVDQLEPFAPNDAVSVLAMTIEEPGCEPWELSLAFPQTTLAALFAGREHKRDRARTPVTPDPMSEPFAALPITLTAVLVDMALPFTRLAALRPGDVIPVAVARSVPLKAGDRTIATGTIGDFEDRIAVQITTAFSQ